MEIYRQQILRLKVLNNVLNWPSTFPGEDQARKFLLAPSWKLDYFQRTLFHEHLKQFPKLNELYWWKEHLHRLYRIKGYNRSIKALHGMIHKMRHSSLPEVQRLAKTLHKWRVEITNYFRFRVTNATTEGYNNIAKLVQRRAFGYKCFGNYRLRVLNACAH